MDQDQVVVQEEVLDYLLQELKTLVVVAEEATTQVEETTVGLE